MRQSMDLTYKHEGLYIQNSIFTNYKYKTVSNLYFPSDAAVLEVQLYVTVAFLTVVTEQY